MNNYSKTYTKKRIYNNNGKYHYNFYRIKKGRKYKITSKVYHNNIKRKRITGGSDYGDLKFIKFQNSNNMSNISDMYPNIKDIYREDTEKDKSPYISFPGLKQKIKVFDNNTNSNKLYTGYLVSRHTLDKYIEDNKGLFTKGKENKDNITNLLSYKENNNIWELKKDEFYQLNKTDTDILLLSRT